MAGGIFTQAFEGRRRTVVPEPMFEQLGLIGCGLMGGSFALALKRTGLVRRVVGYSKSPSTTKRALELGVIDMEAPSALLAAAGADLVLLAVPVGAMEDTLKTIRHLITSHALIMDVGSTKQNIVAAAQRQLGERMAQFVPCHPIAGSEQSGVEAARYDLFIGKQVVLTPTEATAPAYLQKAQQLWQVLESRVLTMTPALHDRTYAAVSHLPHLLAYAYMQAIMMQDGADQMLSMAGTGFQDFTRIAASEPKLWSDVLLENRDEVLQQLQHFQSALHGLELVLRTGDSRSLQEKITAVSHTRTVWRGPRSS